MMNIPLRKVLWVEDSARWELADLAGPVYASGKYLLEIAEDATAAIEYLVNNQFDVLIVDMRIPPGDHPTWQKIYERQGKNQELAPMGMHLLNWMFNGKNHGMAELDKAPEWIKQDMVVVFTVEGREQLDALLAKKEFKDLTYEQKNATRRDTILLELIERIEHKRNHTSIS